MRGFGLGDLIAAHGLQMLTLLMVVIAILASLKLMGVM
jgi:hypothetical protein